jgi:hypothetical protein
VERGDRQQPSDLLDALPCRRGDPANDLDRGWGGVGFPELVVNERCGAMTDPQKLIARVLLEEILPTLDRISDQLQRIRENVLKLQQRKELPNG